MPSSDAERPSPGTGLARSTSHPGVNRSTRSIPAGVLAVIAATVGLAGCVADDTDSGGLTPPEVIRVGTEAGSSMAGDAAAQSAEEPASEEAAIGKVGEDMASSYMPAWDVVVGFEVAADLPALPGADTGYVYRDGASVPEDVAVALASALGVDPTPRERPAEYMVEWAFGPEDGSAPSLTIDSYPQHYWWYSSAWADMDRAMDVPACTESVGADGNVTIDCPEWMPEPPVGVPTAAEAEVRAREIITAAGFDPSTLTFTVSADEWYASVEARRDLVEGIEYAGAASWSFGFAGEGALEWAGGTFTVPEAVGPYPLVDLDTALTRLEEMYVSGMALGGDMAVGVPEPAIAVEPMPTDESMPVETLPMPEPGEMPEPTEITVTLVDVVADLWWVDDVDGNVWLIPAYRFVGDDGGWYTVPAVSDEYMIEQATHGEVEPMPGEGSEGSTGAVEHGAVVSPELEQLLAPIDLSVAAPAVIALLEDLLDGEVAVDEGLLADMAREYGVEMRVVERDGEPLLVTEDYRTDRINVVVVDGTVVAIDGIG
jgi:hypothetical protein